MIFGSRDDAIPTASAVPAQSSVISSSSAGVAAMAVAMVLLLAAGWVLAGRLVTETPPLTVAAIRTAAIFPVLSALVLIRRRHQVGAALALRRPLALLLLAVLGFLLYYSGTMLGTAWIGAAAAGVLVGLLPCITLFIGALGFREKAGSARIGGTVLAVGCSITYGFVHGDPSGPVSAALGTVVLAVLAVLIGTTAYALYGFVYRRTMGDLPSLVSLPGITGTAVPLLAAVALLQPGGLGLSTGQVLPIVLLGAVFTAPVFVLSHELVLRRGPLFATSVAVCVPFLTRIGEWLLGDVPSIEPLELVLFVFTAVGVLITVRADEPPPETR